MNPLNPKKLLLTKWTAVNPVAKQKHFLVSRVIQTDLPEETLELVEIEAVFSKATRWAAAGFMDTLLRCEDETGGGLWEREGNLAGNSRLKQSSWSRSAV